MQDETLLLRQVHPSWIDRDRISSQAFRPTPKDKHLLSVYDGSMISPERAWQHHTQALALQSAGVVAVSLDECRQQALEAESDPEPFREHVVIRFDHLTNSVVEKKAKVLRGFAEARGWLHGPLP